MSNSDFEGSHVVATSLLSGPLCFQPFPCKALKSKWKKPQQVRIKSQSQGTELVAGIWAQEAPSILS